MAWTAPRTWSPGETVTATLMNSHVRDNFNAVSGKAIVIQLGSVDSVAIVAGLKLFIEIPISMKVTGWTVVADASGSIVLDVWRDSYANFPPTAADTITGTEKPTLSSAQKAQDLSLSTWSPNISAGDILAINVDSVATVKQVTLTLRAEPL